MKEDGTEKKKLLRDLARSATLGQKPDISGLSAEELQILVHELGVYQTELETQNEELREARLRLEEARDRYRELYEFAPVGYFTLDAEGVICQINLAGCALLGRERVWLVGRSFSSLLAEESAIELRRRLTPEPGGEKAEPLELTPAFGGKHLRLEIAPRQEGEEWRFRVAAIDLTEVREAEQALRESERRFRSLAETAPLGIFEADHLCRFQYVNEQWARITGLSRDKSRDFGWTAAVHPGDRLRIAGEWSGRIGAEHWSQEFRLRRADGSEGWARIHSAPSGMQDGRPTGYVGALEDITELKRTESALRESEERFRALVMASSEALYRMSPDWSEMRQLHSESFLSKTLEIEGAWRKKYIPPEDLPQVNAAIREAIERKSVFELEHRIRRADGTLGWVSSRAVPFFDEEGELVEWFGAASDITERKEMEKKLRDATAAAEEASRAKSEFLANMSHEIRTPMTVTLSALELLKASGLREEQTQLLEMAETASHSLLALLNDILDSSKIEARKIELRPERCLVAHCLEKAVALFSLQARNKGVELSIEIDPGAPAVVFLDCDRLHQVLTNLIGNAVKFTEKGRIVAGAAPHGEGLLFSVRDTGIGIPQDQLERLFESFTQPDASHTRRYGGTGLGLAISKGLVELMGGRIWAQSRPGEGTTFFFTLPQRGAGAGIRAPQGRERGG